MVGLGSADTMLAAGAGEDGRAMTDGAVTEMRCAAGKENSPGARGGDADEEGRNFGQALV